MRHSDRLVVLWTPTYFERLWCAYELASWIYLGKSHICFVPVSLAVLAGWAGLGLYAQHALLFLFEALIGRPPTWFVLGAAWMGVSFLTYAARFHVLELSRLPNQLSQFSVQRTRCFCCDTGHIHPQTLQRMPCDRMLVYDALQDWFSKLHGECNISDGEELSHLDFFDKQVQQQIKSHILSSAGFQASYRDALIVSTPMVWYYLNKGPYLEVMPPVEWARWALYVASMVFGAWPMAWDVNLLLLSYYERVMVGSSESYVLKTLSTLATTGSSFCVTLALWAIGVIPFFHVKSPLPQIVASLFTDSLLLSKARSEVPVQLTTRT
eukprot:CAMPEP_0170570308 /NCGR_PEP_ID=MMETSP0224-20130122/1037_1 /TAXON_ID=285029 /ORGANISM="Togula jolla, Strain CCCM 725" /LENGTH=323 /DNA_ID=CAMNT_0010892569 /DNA_START=664 /DNA_END=1631 /DNA_ORIENTATION=-